MASGLAGGFAKPAEQLGLHEESARWKLIEKRVTESNQERGNRPFIVDGHPVERGTKTGGLTGSVEMISRFSEQQPPLSDKNLEPMRLVGHELASRFLGYVSWLLMVLCMGFAACYRYRVATLSRRPAVRMVDLLDRTDWAWIRLRQPQHVDEKLRFFSRACTPHSYRPCGRAEAETALPVSSS